MATEKQIELIQKLCKQKGQVISLKDIEDSDNGSASQLIEELLDRDDVNKAKTTKKVTTETSGFNGMRFGMCVKIICDKLSELPNNNDAWKTFDGHVTELYNIVTDIEAGINNSGSD